MKELIYEGEKVEHAQKAPAAYVIESFGNIGFW